MIGSEFMVWQMGPKLKKHEKEFKKNKLNKKHENKRDKLEKTPCSLSTKEETKKHI
jgi:hypothetical protein